MLDYLGQDGTGAEGFGLTVAPSGSIYASGISDSPSHGVVLASSDGGYTWSLADVFAPPGRYAYWENFFGGITSDAAGNLYVSGLTYSEDGIQPDQWYVRRSTDGGTTWTTVDDFDPGCPPNTTGDVRGITVDAAGDVYVSGRSFDAALNVRPWTIRKGVGGISFSTVDTVPNAYPCAVFAHPTAGIFAVGRRSIVVRNKSSDAWTVRRSTNGGATWSNVETFQLASGESAIAVDISGNVFVTGSSSSRGGTDDPTFNDYATVAYSNSGVPLWTNRYDGPGNGSDFPKGIAVDNRGNVFVTGTSWNGSNTDYATIKYSNTGVPLWTNRFNGRRNGGDDAWGIAVDSSGNVFVTGSASLQSKEGFAEDFATVAYSSAGVPLWTNYYHAPINLADAARAIAVDHRGNVFVTGISWYGSTSQIDYTTIKYSSSVPPPPHLDFQLLNNQLVLSWTNAGFSLQSAPVVTGPFTNRPAASSPYTNLLSAPQQFFRLKAN